VLRTISDGFLTGNEDLNETVTTMREWIAQNEVFEYGDLSGMCNMPNSDGAIDMALGIAQQQIFLPIKFKQMEEKK